MIKVRLNLRNVVAVATCLAGFLGSGKKKFSLMVVALLVSTAGFAQMNLFDKFENGEWRNPYAYSVVKDGDDWVITFDNDYSEIVIMFEPGEIIANNPNNNKVVIEWEGLETTDSKFPPAVGMWIENSDGDWRFQDDDVVDEYELKGNVGEIVGIGIYASWHLVKPAQLRIKKLEIIADESTGIIETGSTAQANIIGYYSITGQHLSQEPQHGIYIIMYSDGTTKKAVKN